MKVSKKDYAESFERLREWIKPGDTVYTILDHVSSSGMSRAIRVVVPSCQDGRVDFTHPNYAVGKVLGMRHWTRNGREQDALVIGGCGMDMGFSLVYHLSSVLYPEYACLGQGKCPAAYHTNYRSTVQCHGPEDSERGFCWRPDPWSSRFPVPEGWPRGEAIEIGDGATIPGPLLYCLHTDEGQPYEVCPKCKGVGSFANPDGPERFDLMHNDGYALRHKWL